MSKKDVMHLIDAGLFLNSPYPSVLREARDVDIILSFDFSMDDPFGTLKEASDYAAANKRPFPKIDFAKLHPDHPDSFYVFEEEGKPTIIHIPLFNIDNCENESTITEESKEYTTFQMIYRDKNKIDHLADLAAMNVKINRDGILEEIRKTSERRSSAICQFVQDMRSC
ncbi:cytosolic phospholipase A2 gamma-like [Alosa sapidissima]|uniref:cytosolic phospholipase A2 gamma-like n=1 Tax=Alosa sapidissima TaxID=34773 RepID=UPI001C095C37|nr:cytosolic phospholipase A2 gamma-like [Alosa sapidissima]